MCIYVDEAIIEIKVKAETREDLLRRMASKLLQAGLVRDDFFEAVIAREEKYPTGLPTSIPVALCHVEAEYIRKSFVALATLEKPVEFHEMGNPTQVQPVEIVFVIGIAEKERHMDALKGILRLIQEAETLKAIRAAESGQDILQLLAGRLETTPAPRG